MTRSRLNVAAVGLGWVTQNRHLPTMMADPQYKIVGVIDRSPKLAASVAEKFNITRHAGTESLSDVPWISEVDAITVGAAPHAHFVLLQQALLMGKHVLTEKPFVLETHEGEALCRLAREQKLQLGIVHNFQFSNSFSRLERDLNAGRIGPIRSVVARQFGNPRRRLPTWYESLPFGLYYDESPHLLYLIRRLSLGNPRLLRVDGIAGSANAKTPKLVEALYESGDASGNFHISMLLSFEAPISEWFITVFGEHGTGIVDLFRDIYIFLPNDGVHTTATVLRTSLTATWQHWIAHFRSGARHLTGTLRYGNDHIFHRFAQAVLHNIPLEVIGADDALAVLKMQHEILTHCTLR